jgi:hypothetical protein
VIEKKTMARYVASNKAQDGGKVTKSRRVLQRIPAIFFVVLQLFFMQAASTILLGAVGECQAFLSHSDANSSYRRSSPSSLKDATRSSETQNIWTSMWNVDPTMILSILASRGGLLIPDSVQAEIVELQKIVHVEQAKLNVVEKQVILYNLTVALEGQEDAIRVGRVFVHWDSYSKPCLDVEVDDVHVLVDFTNLILTRNNWNELRPILIPGSFRPVTDRFKPRRIAAHLLLPKEQRQQQSASDVFLRFSSIDLKGKATVRLSSRPLDKDIGSFGLDMGLTTDSINAKIRELSDSNKVGTDGRRGCTSYQLADLLQYHFTQQIRAFLKSHLQDLKSDPRSAIRKADRILDKTKGVGGSILDYANDARRKKRGDIENVVKDKWGRVRRSLGVDEIKSFREQSLKHGNVTLLKDELKRISQDLKLKFVDSQDDYSDSVNCRYSCCTDGIPVVEQDVTSPDV